MRITKADLRNIRDELTSRQAIMCAMAADGKLVEEHKKRYPHYIGPICDNTFELLRQLMYDDVERLTRKYID